MNRRDFWKSSVLSTASLVLASGREAVSREETAPPAPVALIDTYVNLFDWPFRTLKYGETEKLAAKLAKHRITEAWAGSYESLLHKNIDLVNARLATECTRSKAVKLLPVGTVNPTWPDWEEDLRRCREQYKMEGIRLFPIYQMIDFNDEKFKRLVVRAAELGLFIQIVGDVEDPRHNHPLLGLKDVKFDPLVEIARAVPEARIQLLHWNRKVPNPLLEKILAHTGIVLDHSRVEGAGELGRLLNGNSWYGPKDLKIGSERFLFGSHAPFFPLESALFKLFESPLTDGQLTAVMHKNAQKFKTPAR